MDISESDRDVIGQIANLVLKAQESEGVNAESILRPYVETISSRCEQMVEGNPAVLTFVADMINTSNKWSMGDWADGTVAHIQDSVWSSLGDQLKLIPGASEALETMD